jgi:hypothetical protein
MIEKFLDEYEVKARVAPGLIVALPVLVDAVYAAPALSGWPIFAAGGVCSLALIYGLGHLARARGEAIEPALWNRWGGPPSTRFLRHRDLAFARDLKGAIRRAVTERFSVTLLSAHDEATEPGRADSAIADAFRQVRQYLRQHDPNGLWYKHGVEYGYSRNLLGCRPIWAVVSLAATIFAAWHGARTGAGILNPASTIALLSLICAGYVGWAILPKATKRIAEGYAELAWIAFLRVSEEDRHANN